MFRPTRSTSDDGSTNLALGHDVVVLERRPGLRQIKLESGRQAGCESPVLEEGNSRTEMPSSRKTPVGRNSAAMVAPLPSKPPETHSPCALTPLLLSRRLSWIGMDWTERRRLATVVDEGTAGTLCALGHPNQVRKN